MAVISAMRVPLSLKCGGLLPCYLINRGACGKPVSLQQGSGWLGRYIRSKWNAVLPGLLLIASYRKAPSTPARSRLIEHP
jgi:hypothetical protein